MRTDRRSFFRLLAGAAALLSGKISAAKSTPERFDIHQATRNTRFGALGARRPRLSRAPLDHKRYPGKRRVTLPARVDEPARTLAEIVREWTPAEGFAAAAISLAQLGRLLHFTNGVTLKAPPGGRGPARRAAPSAGALYSGEVYVAAARVQGLAPGVYYYEVAQHRLVQAAAGFEPAQLAAAIERPESIEGAAATILLTNVFGRYSWKYANRGYRYALIDSGHIGENLRLAAASAGLAQRDFLAFRDDLLNDLLAIDGVEEAVCSVHAVGLPGSVRDAVAEPPGAAAEAAPTSVEPPRAVADAPPTSVEPPGVPPQPRQAWVEARRTPAFSARGPITERYHSATKLVPQGVTVAPFAAPKDLASRALEPNLPLPARAAGPAMKVEDAIQIRRSTARFESKRLSLADFAHVLEMAHGHASLARSDNVDVYLVVHRVETLEPGLYRYDRDHHRLVAHRTGSLVDDFTRVCLGQEKAGTAAVGVLMVARLGEGRALASTRRYRDMLVESGAIGQRIYLAAESAGLSARNLAAFRDDDLNRLLGLDGQREAAIHLTMLGPGN
jgi:SagB-type dehydrogenase family enzyme